MMKMSGKKQTRILEVGASDEDFLAYMKEMCDERQKEDEEELFKKQSQTPERTRIEYPYWEILQIDKELVPLFMVGLFMTPFISTSEKDKFALEFCRKYLDDTEFKNNMDGKFLYFENNVINCIIDDPSDLPKYDHYVSKLIIPIGKLPQHNRYGKISQNLPHNTVIYDPKDTKHTFRDKTITEKITIVRPTSFQIDCNINNTTIRETSFSKRKIIDTGCEISPIFDKCFWDFNNGRFINPILHPYEDKKCLEIFNTCNGPKSEYVIYLNKPLFIWLGNLIPIKIFSFSVPLDIKDSLNHLIGMDIISQYTLIFSNFDGEYKMKITELREEF